MKKIIIVLMVLLCSSIAYANPFLVCDPYPAEQEVTYFSMLVDGSAVSVPYALHSSGAAIVLDLGQLNISSHQITEIKACNVRGCGDPVPLFSVPGIPSSLNGLRLIP